MIKRIKNWLIGLLAPRSLNKKLLKYCDDQKALIDKLNKALETKEGVKEVFTIINLPSVETAPEYLNALSNFYGSNYIKAFFFERERRWIADFKNGTVEPALARGALHAIEDILQILAKSAQQYRDYVEAREREQV